METKAHPHDYIQALKLLEEIVNPDLTCGWTHEDEHVIACGYCSGYGWAAKAIEHREDCPIGKAIKLLDKLTSES